VVCMQGRFHSYEGYPLWKVSFCGKLGVAHSRPNTACHEETSPVNNLDLADNIPGSSIQAVGSGDPGRYERCRVKFNLRSEEST
jgi:hypothetical protein